MRMNIECGRTGIKEGRNMSVYRAKSVNPKNDGIDVEQDKNEKVI